MKDDFRATVRALLGAAGITPSKEEVEEMALAYPALRAAADSMYTDEISDYPAACPPSDEDSPSR